MNFESIRNEFKNNGFQRTIAWPFAPHEQSRTPIDGLIGAETRNANGIAMKPYYSRQGVELYHGECHDVMPALKPNSFAALITDPPYSSGGATLAARSCDPARKYLKHGGDRPTFSGDAKDQRGFTAWSIFWLSEGRRLLKPGGYGLVFTDWRQLPSMTDALQGADFTWRGLMAWDKGGASRAPHKGYARHQCEYVIWGTNGCCEHRLDAGPFPGCYRYPVLQRDKYHLTGKPTPLMVDLVKFCPPGDRVLDCFAGSGTTLVACAMTGRKAVGIERERAYCDITAERIDAALDSLA